MPVPENVRLYKEKPAPLLLRVEPGTSVKFVDAVKGTQDIHTDTIRDPMLLRGPNESGLCRAVYNFATVVDDIDFKITHVIRAIEHLSNTPPQILMYEALGAKNVVNRYRSAGAAGGKKGARSLVLGLLAPFFQEAPAT